MATPKTPEVPCWNRRFVSEIEMQALLGLKKPAWEKFRQDNLMRIRPNGFGKYDREVVESVFAKQ